MIEQEYGISIDSKELGETVFRTINSLAEYILEHRTS
jgi:acyl carrier protein